MLYSFTIRLTIIPNDLEIMNGPKITQARESVFLVYTLNDTIAVKSSITAEWRVP